MQASLKSMLFASVCLPCIAFAQPTTTRLVSGPVGPVFVTHAPGDYDRLFLVQQAGLIRIVRDGVVRANPFLDIRSSVASGGEMGLLGLAFHPEYSSNGYFYVNFTAYTATGIETIVRRYRVSPDPDRADVATGQAVIRFDQPSTTHNGGWMGFGPDGSLYIASGDGGRGVVQNNAQNITNLLGKILRIDVDSDYWPEDTDRNYAIPPDNPFVGTPGADEIWVYGLRNPWRCAFDPLTGDFYIGDVGENSWEEINFVPHGHPGGIDFGWRCKEGDSCSGLEGCSCVTDAMVDPIYAYGHTPNCSITGGEVYRGCAIPELYGAYFFADFCTANIWSMTYDGANPPVITEWTAEFDPGDGLSINRVSSFGRDAFGELYICDWSSAEVFKIVPGNDPAPISIIESHPPDGAIDARQPSDPDGVTLQGWDSVMLRFGGCAANVVAQDFEVSQNGGEDPPPTVAEVVGVAEDAVMVVLNRPLEPRAWTTITHLPSGRDVTLGALPGDCDGNLVVEATDLLVVLDALGDGSTFHPLRSVDIDRSGRIAVCDILRELDLLLGSTEYDVFNGATLP